MSEKVKSDYSCTHSGMGLIITNGSTDTPVLELENVEDHTRVYYVHCSCTRMLTVCCGCCVISATNFSVVQNSGHSHRSVIRVCVFVKPWYHVDAM